MRRREYSSECSSKQPAERGHKAQVAEEQQRAVTAGPGIYRRELDITPIAVAAGVSDAVAFPFLSSSMYVPVHIAVTCHIQHKTSTGEVCRMIPKNK